MNGFEVGSQWRTRGGWRAVVVAIGKAWHEEPLTTRSYTKAVLSFNPAGAADVAKSYDLVEPWVDPVEHEGWVSVFWNGKSDSAISFGELYEDKHSKPRAIACIKIKFEEGEGL